MTRKLGYVPALDGLRGIAILAVTAQHFFGLRGGFFGVDLFFVLSGFLITTLLLEEHDGSERVSLRAFYLRRARRLLPALGALLLLITVIGSTTSPPGRLLEIVASGAFYSANIVRAFGHPDVLLATPAGHLWSLAQEEQFYLVWPPAFLALRGRIRDQRILAGLALFFIGLIFYRGAIAGSASWQRVYFAPDTHADGLALGCALAFARQRGLRAHVAAGWLALAVFATAAVLGTQTRSWLVFGLPVVELTAAALVLGALVPGPFRAFLSWRPLVWIGAVSYSLYVWQEPARWLTSFEHPWTALALTAVLTLVSYYLIERPFRSHRKGAPALEPAAAS